MSDTKLLLNDFRAFMFYVWHHVGLPEPTDIQLDMAAWLMQNHPRKGIMAFRGAAKSWISCAFCVWLLLRNNEEKIFVVSAGENKAIENAFFIKRLINELPICEPLRGGERDSVRAFDVAGCMPAIAPSVRTVGVTGQMTGGRATYILADDVEVPNNSDTQAKRELLSERIKEFDAILVPGGTVCFLGTPQSEESIYNILREERGYVFRIWPARYPLVTKIGDYRGDLAPSLMKAYESGIGCEWKPTDPIRFSDSDLCAREASFCKTGFALQFMLDTTLSDQDRYPLKLKDLIVTDVTAEGAPTKILWTNDKSKLIENLGNPGLTGDGFYSPSYSTNEFKAFEGLVMSIDPSGRGKDETAYAIVGQLMGRLYLLKVGGLASGEEGFSDDVLKELINQAKLWGVKEILVEENAGHGMFTNLLKAAMRTTHNVMVSEIRQSRQKELRIVQNLEPLLNQHRIVVNRSVIDEDSKVPQRDFRLFYQMTRMTSDRGALVHDDRIDACEMALGFFIDSMARNSEKAFEDNQWAVLKREEREFAKSLSRCRLVDNRIGNEVPRGRPRRTMRDW